eukprot:8596664-Pyramimonas_sp.AAC.1
MAAHAVKVRTRATSGPSAAMGAPKVSGEGAHTGSEQSDSALTRIGLWQEVNYKPGQDARKTPKALNSNPKLEHRNQGL